MPRMPIYMVFFIEIWFLQNICIFRIDEHNTLLTVHSARYANKSKY